MRTSSVTRSPMRNSKICARFIIPSKFAGQLIGKRGAHINSLRDTYAVQIAIPDSTTAERICRVMSEDLDSVIECVRDIALKLGPDMQTINNRLDDGHIEMRLLVNIAHCGGIIGSQGAHIKELREISGATIDMHGECCPGSFDRILQVGGEPDAVIDVLYKTIANLASLEPPAENKCKGYEPGMAVAAPGVHYGGIKGDGTSHPSSREHHNGYPNSNAFIPSGYYDYYATPNNLHFAPIPYKEYSPFPTMMDPQRSTTRDHGIPGLNLAGMDPAMSSMDTTYCTPRDTDPPRPEYPHDGWPSPINDSMQGQMTPSMMENYTMPWLQSGFNYMSLTDGYRRLPGHPRTTPGKCLGTTPATTPRTASGTTPGATPRTTHGPMGDKSKKTPITPSPHITKAATTTTNWQM